MFMLASFWAVFEIQWSDIHDSLPLWQEEPNSAPLVGIRGQKPGLVRPGGACGLAH